MHRCRKEEMQLFAREFWIQRQRDRACVKRPQVDRQEGELVGSAKRYSITLRDTDRTKPRAHFWANASSSPNE